MTPTTAVSKEGYKVVSQYILDRFPSDAGGFRASFGYQVLSRLSQSLSRLPYHSDQKPEHLDNYRRDIEIAPALLEDLLQLLREGYLDKAEVEGKANKKNMQRGKASRSKVTSVAHVEINDRLSTALGRKAPKDRDSAEEMIRSIMVTQKSALEVRLSPVPPLLTPFRAFIKCLLSSLRPSCGPPRPKR